MTMVTIESRVAEVEEEVRGLKRTVAALAENILREMAARGALLLVKAPAEEVMAEIVERSTAQVLEEINLAEEEEGESKTTDVVMEEEGTSAMGGTKSTTKEAMTMTEEGRKTPAVIELDGEEDEEAPMASDDTVMETEAAEPTVRGVAVVIEDEEKEEEDQRMVVDTSQESSASGSSRVSSAGSEVGDAMPLSLSAFDDVVSRSSHMSSFAPPPPPLPARFPCRPPTIIPVINPLKSTKVLSATSIPKKQRSSKSKRAMPAAVPQAVTQSPTQVSPRVAPEAATPIRTIVRAPAPLPAPAPASIVPSASTRIIPPAPKKARGLVPAPAPVRFPTLAPISIPARSPAPIPAQAPAPVHAPASVHTVTPAQVAAFIAEQSATAPAFDIVLPEDFEVQTKDSVAVAWEKWCCGERARGIPPLRSIAPKQVAVKAVSRRLSDLRCAMLPIEIMAQTNGMWRDDFTPREAAAVVAELENHLPIFASTAGSDGRKRKKEIAWSTALNNMRKKRKQQHDVGMDQALI